MKRSTYSFLSVLMYSKSPSLAGSNSSLLRGLMNCEILNGGPMRPILVHILLDRSSHSCIDTENAALQICAARRGDDRASAATFRGAHLSLSHAEQKRRAAMCRRPQGLVPYLPKPASPV
jgi:hypothetical protein